MRLVKSDSHRQERMRNSEILKGRRDFQPGSVVLTLDSSNEMMFQLDAYPYLTSSLNQTYVVSATTEELFERYLVVSWLLRGNFGPIPLLVKEDGLPLATLTQRMSPADQRWFELLRNCVGSNSFIFHPQKNLLDLRQKGLTLPPHLAGREELVVYLSPRLCGRFFRFQRQAEAALRAGRPMPWPFRLDYALLPKRDLESAGGLHRMGHVIQAGDEYLLVRF